MIYFLAGTIEKTRDEVNLFYEIAQGAGEILTAIFNVIRISALPALIVFLAIKIICNWINKHR